MKREHIITIIITLVMLFSGNSFAIQEIDNDWLANNRDGNTGGWTWTVNAQGGAGAGDYYKVMETITIDGPLVLEAGVNVRVGGSGEGFLIRVDEDDDEETEYVGSIVAEGEQGNMVAFRDWSDAGADVWHGILLLGDSGTSSFEWCSFINVRFSSDYYSIDARNCDGLTLRQIQDLLRSMGTKINF